jgi:hypothetical protein
MWLVEIVAELFLRTVLETVIGGLSYLTGAVLVKVMTVGQVDLAPLSTLQETNRTPKGKWDWSIWLHRQGKRSALKADWVCVVGFLVWIVIGVCIYQATKDRELLEKSAVPAVVK